MVWWFEIRNEKGKKLRKLEFHVAESQIGKWDEEHQNFIVDYKKKKK